MSNSSGSIAMTLSVLNFPDSYRIETPEKLGSQLGIVERVALLDA